MNQEKQKSITDFLYQENFEETHIKMPFEDMMKLFDELTFFEKWMKVNYGLKQPKDTGDYKWASLQIKRLISPISAIAIPSLALLITIILSGMSPQPRQIFHIENTEYQEVPILDEIQPIDDPEIQPDHKDIIEPIDNFIVTASKNQVGPDVNFSPQPAQFDSVAIIRSPVQMRGIFGHRSPGARGHLVGIRGGGTHTESAVLRALRWLKKYQEEDGSWNGTSGEGIGKNNVKAAMTGMALLAFLAHGETQISPEFGKTVENAIKYLVENPNWPTAYQWPIATYALSEAYAMTKLPSILPVVENGLDHIISGQGATGGWTYQLNASQRNDGSINGWCVQALKAGQMASISRPGLEQAMHRATEGWESLFKGNSEQGGFGYTSPSIGNPTPGGALSLQLLGKLQSDNLRGAINHLSQRNDGEQMNNWKKIYWTYYHTQVMFHEGGDTWKNWNKSFSVPLVNAQNIIPNAITDLSGKTVDIGYWDVKNDRGGKVMDTVLSALQLMVYYRYLPTFQSPEEILANNVPENIPEIIKAKDLKIELEL